MSSGQRNDEEHTRRIKRTALKQLNSSLESTGKCTYKVLGLHLKLHPQDLRKTLTRLSNDTLRLSSGSDNLLALTTMINF